MAKGAIAKENLMNMLIKNLPDGVYLGQVDKKYYFVSEENGERMQVAIALTVPKNPVTSFSDTGSVAPATTSNKAAWEVDEASPISPSAPVPSPEEQERIKKLMEELGI